MSWITAILAIISKLLGLFSKDERAVEHSEGERLGVAETKVATAEAAVKEATSATKNEEAVGRLSDSELNAELRDGAK